MFILAKLQRFLGLRTAPEACARTVELLLSGATADASWKAMVQEGYSHALAARAVTLIPSAFARVIYEPEGIRFPDFFYSGAKAYREKTITRYNNEPVFKAALSLAKRMQAEGQSERVMQIVELSTEHDAITKARADGLTPSDFSILIHEF